MTDAQRPNPIHPHNQNSMNTLVRAIRLSAGQFSLILIQCNYARVRDRIAHQLRECCPLTIRELVLPADTDTLFTAIKAVLGEEQPAAVIVFGLESVKDLNTVLNSTNQVREEFPKHFPRPLVLWINDSILRQLIRVAPDLESWATTIPFEISTEELTDLINQTVDEIFTQLLHSHETLFLDNTALNLGEDSPRRVELQAACRELQGRQEIFAPALAANVEFILGRVADNSTDESRRHYEQSLALWRQANQPEHSGHLLFYLGLWWMNYAAQHLAERQPALQQAEAYLKQAIASFEQADRLDLAARFINFWAEVLHRQQNWLALEQVANQALELHQTYSDQFRLARAHGFLAEAALARSAWRQAQQSAQAALHLMEQAEVALKTVSPDEDNYLDLQHSFHQGWYLFSLAKAQYQLGESLAAIETLIAAKLRTKPCYDPELYIAILGALQEYYFQQRDYLSAFEIKRSQQKIESQFGLRAFIGAARLQTKQTIANPALPTHESQATAAVEIAASGRQQDVNRLLERMGRPDVRLTIIHGQSGVGKSSILQAGLIPALRQRTFESREVIPVLQRVYANWEKELGQQLAAAYTCIRPAGAKPLVLEAASHILEQLQRNSDENLLTVLIFDQFEEFFFSRPTLAERLSFYSFASKCLNIPYIKVILSIREDYLHYLLICNRLTGLEVINNNILDKNILYYLGNFSKEDARSVIQSLSEQAHLAWAPYLINQLVADLADELGQVRPIELQLLGAQLQAEGIRTLTQYLAQGKNPKEVIVERYLEEVVKDCGSENSRAAELVLYLLTDEEGVRPQKTRAELLEAESLAAESQKVDLVLRIFIRSGLVMGLPAAPADRYQLVHDYLVRLVRQKYGKKIVEELSNLRKQVQVQAEQEKKKLRRLSLVGLLGALLFAILTDKFQSALQVIEASKAEIEISKAEVDRSNLILELELEGPKSIQKFEFSQIKGLLSAIQSAAELRHRFSAPYPATSPVWALQKIVYSIHEKNWFDSEQKRVLWVSFSPDGELFA
ncbi:MAG: ATP-binding protein, partial [Pseudanabaenales cyanobacterium]|nr:ATP-binding protein [Pseudanabaenales cyanobacterium]